MALIKCPHCGANVSDKAHRCPKCNILLNKPQETTEVKPVASTPPVIVSPHAEMPLPEPTYQEEHRSSSKRVIWIALIAVVILGAIIAAFALASNYTDEIVEPDIETEQIEMVAPIAEEDEEDVAVINTRTTPDLSLFEVQGYPKQVTVSNPIYMTEILSTTIKFNDSGEWTNYADIASNTERGLFISLSRGNGNISAINYATDNHDDEAQERSSMEGWKREIGWEDGVPSILTYTEHEVTGGDYDLLYTDGKLVRVNTMWQELGGGEGQIIVYKLRDVKYDDKGNWIERKWSKRTETFDDDAERYQYIKPPFRGERHKITSLDSTYVTETRQITYYQ